MGDRYWDEPYFTGPGSSEVKYYTRRELGLFGTKVTKIRYTPMNYHEPLNVFKELERG